MLAPAASALVISPLYLMPPSAITGTPWRSATRAQSKIAVSCGMPAPEITRVVQIEAGPMPTLTASTPRSTSAIVAAPVETLPATSCTFEKCSRTRTTVSSTPCEWPCAVSTISTVDAGRHQRFGSLERIFAYAKRRPDA